MTTDGRDDPRRNRFAWGPGDLVRVEPELIDAAAMAQAAGVDLGIFEAALKDAKLRSETEDGHWIASKGSTEHGDLKRILTSLLTKPSNR